MRMFAASKLMIMKATPLLFWSLFLGLSLCSRAATLIVPAEQPALTIPAGEAILFDFYAPNAGYVQVISQGVTNSVDHFSPAPERPTVLAGPLTIMFPPNSSTPEGQTILPQVINYRPLGKVAITTLVLRAGVSNTIEVPPGKTIHFFPTILNSSAFYVFLRRGTNSTIIYPDPLSNSELTGPLTIDLLAEGEGILVSYQFVEDFSVLPDLGAVRVPAGSSLFTVEKSLNLTNWQPVFLHQRTSDENSFYRFKVSR